MVFYLYILLAKQEVGIKDKLSYGTAPYPLCVPSNIYIDNTHIQDHQYKIRINSLRMDTKITSISECF